MDKKKKIIAVLVIIVISVVAILVSTMKKGEAPTAPVATQQTEVKETKPETTEEKETMPETASKSEDKEAQTAEEKIKVMYYVANTDAQKDAALKAIENVKKEYADRADFSVINIDEEPEKVFNFALPDETPKIIILGTNGEFEMKNHCADEAQIKEVIEKVLNPA